MLLISPVALLLAGGVVSVAAQQGYGTHNDTSPGGDDLASPGGDDLASAPYSTSLLSLSTRVYSNGFVVSLAYFFVLARENIYLRRRGFEP
jgi:hypothetical protein